MNYELAKKLKDAGFPQNPFRNICVHSGKCDPMEMWVCDCKKEDKVYPPTLSELIEACEPHKADDFMLRIFCGECEAGLVYNGYIEGWPGVERDNDGAVSINLGIKGSTLDESVSNLWLALNKK